MAGAAVRRDDEALRAGLERWLDAPVAGISRPAAGWSCETVIVEPAAGAGPGRAGVQPFLGVPIAAGLVVDGRIVVRLPPTGDGIFPSYDLAQQTAVQAAAGGAGVPVAPALHVADESFLGCEFVAMPFVVGAIPSEFTAGDPWLTGLPSDELRSRPWGSLLDTIVAIHGAPPGGLGLRTGLDAELDFWGEYVQWACDGAPPPALVDGLAWCRSHRPPSPPDGLLWGDVRLGNIIFDPRSCVPAAVLDWDMASVGPIEMDLAWFLALEQVQIDLTGMTIPGFGTPAEARARVAASVGRELIAMAWFEIFALLRASAISTRLAILHERAGQKSMFKVGKDPTLAAALSRIDAS